MAATLCKGLGSQLSIEPNIFGRLSELEDYISNYYNMLKWKFVGQNLAFFIKHTYKGAPAIA